MDTTDNTACLSPLLSVDRGVSHFFLRKITFLILLVLSGFSHAVVLSPEDVPFPFDDIYCTGEVSPEEYCASTATAIFPVPGLLFPTHVTYTFVTSIHFNCSSPAVLPQYPDSLTYQGGHYTAPGCPPGEVRDLITLECERPPRYFLQEGPQPKNCEDAEGNPCSPATGNKFQTFTDYTSEAVKKSVTP